MRLRLGAAAQKGVHNSCHSSPRLPISVRHANKHINNILRKTWQSGAAHTPSLSPSHQDVVEHKMQLINHSGKSSFAAWFIFVASPSGCQPQQKLKFFICRQAGRRRRQCDPSSLSADKFSTYWQRWRPNWPKYCSIKKQPNEAKRTKRREKTTARASGDSRKGMPPSHGAGWRIFSFRSVWFGSSLSPGGSASAPLPHAQLYESIN